MNKRYIIKQKCWDYPNTEPYTDYITQKGFPMEFNTKESAMITLLSEAIEEANSLNFILNEDGTFGTANGRQFIPDLNADHDCIIRAWDGEDYMNVTAYDVVDTESDRESIFDYLCPGRTPDQTRDSFPCTYCRLYVNGKCQMYEKYGNGEE